MAFVYACELPDHLWFDVERDVWVQPWEDGTVRLGMTDPAQTRAGRIVYVRVRVGRTIAAGKSVATIESGKWVGPFPSPLSGTVLSANPKVMADPNVINRDPYGQGWLVQLRPSDATWREASGLLCGSDAVSAYRTKLAAEGLTCLRCADSNGEIGPPQTERTI
ncbi:MAG: glycine cleavage system protein H [Sulfobacillus acidophilus]|uniref:Glycine cleavage system protein H n=1 Tax=Sulfobacillus acidophilus TaxID=53633 RepID=A0A2T2WG32_9FIRM|nr:MAG: glycine cleavage system protein H [Sulfobacillus acidophilus]